MTNAVDRIKNIKKQNNIRNNNNNNNKKLAYKIQKLREKQDYFDDKYNNPTIEEIKSKIEEHRRNNTIYTAQNRDEAFKYIHDWKYAVDIIAEYQKSSRLKSGHRTMCLVNVYVLIRETNECIFADHIWLNERLSEYFVLYYTEKYKDEPGGEVFISRLKAMKYANNYAKDGSYSIRYQLSSENKTRRAEYVKAIQANNGIKMTTDEIRAML